jgi:hypothetical protein
MEEDLADVSDIIHGVFLTDSPNIFVTYSLRQRKIPMTPSGMELATFRF